MSFYNIPPTDPNAKWVSASQLEYADLTNPQTKDDWGWWNKPNQPGVEFHKSLHEKSTWVNGRRIAYGTSRCQKDEDCYQIDGDKRSQCDTGLAMAVDCLAHEPHEVKCDLGPDAQNGYCIINTSS